MPTEQTSTFVTAENDLETPHGSGPRGGVILDDSIAPGIGNCLGAVSIAPGSPPTDTLAHSTSEVMYVAQGEGRLHTDDGPINFTRGTAIFIPAQAWHSLENTGDSDLISVFSFPAPHRPDTWSKDT